ncbi:MAG TPA: lyase family protein [Phycisphaerales bacterium]|nr:lyase family protein [Phycisphaerales bacterium]
MTSQYDTYTSPLAARNASKEMLRIWSPRHKFQTWRRIWLAVAEAQHEMGLPVTREQVEELRANLEVTDADMQAAEGYERKLRHDVMAHVHAWGDRCPKAKGIIHLGCTSEDIGSNADLIILWDALRLIEQKTARAVLSFTAPAQRWAAAPTLGFTHYQPAQPVTVGRRIANWASDLNLCLEALDHRAKSLLFKRRGLRGATGTQASFLSLCGDDHDRVDLLEAGFLYELDEKGYALAPWKADEAWEADKAARIERLRYVASRANDPNEGASEQAQKWLRQAEELATMPVAEYRVRESIDFTGMRTFPIVGQTYPRVIDSLILSDLAATASVLHKIATDIRLLSNRKELDEPFEEKQIGSSAMPYKRNPMRCERICGLTRFVMNLVGNAYDTAATQWLERTLDDSSNRRLSLPEAFLALDGALDLMHNVAGGLIVHEAMVRKNLMAELPFMATENILMACVKAGGDRQEYHELIRQHAQAAGLRVKQEGLDNDLLERLKADRHFWSKQRGGPLGVELDWDGLMDPMKYIGRSVEQTERFLREVVEPLKQRYADKIAELGESGPRV